MERFAEVALHLARVQGTFHYSLPEGLASAVAPGNLVVVPFGPRRAQGIVVRLTGDSPVAETRPIESLVEAQPVVTEGQLGLAAWLHDEIGASLGDCLSLMIPPGLAQHADQRYDLIDSSVQSTSQTSARLLTLLRTRGPLRGRQIDRAMGRVDWRRSAQGLIRRGALNSTPILEAPTVSARRARRVRLNRPPAEVAGIDGLGRPPAAGRRRRVLEALLAEGGPLDVMWLYAEAGARPDDLRFLRDRGLIAFDSGEAFRDPLADSAVAPSAAPVLTPDQQMCWDVIRAGIGSAGGAYLLHGVTGSGKTEIYMQAVAHVLRDGGSAIVLVPEISLTPQATDRFVARFPGQVGVLHSGLSAGERFDTWRRARAGAVRVVVGARSALFAPLPRLRLIVLDEEHDPSYKEQEGPVRYHARSAALAYARFLGGVCLLGSATPDVVTYSRARSGELRLLELPQRISSDGAPPQGRPAPLALPPVHIVDMRQELKAGNMSLFSRRLAEALAETLARGEQAILFLNRRGAETYVFCRDCGWVARCPRCETPLTHHPALDALRCHTCGYRRKAPSTCPQCRGRRVRYFGAGTQRIEAELAARFPKARTLRWDWDATRRKGAHHVILAHFAAHRADVLIGTQMLAKGLDVPRVTLVGVVSADTGLFLPDYRAAERTFQILTQVAGRAGRGRAGGQVILQTYHPELAVIRAAARHDYRGFYESELPLRRELGYPPFRRLVRLVLRGTSPDRVERESARLAARLRAETARHGRGVEVLGPTPCFYARQGGYLRWQILLRGADPAAVVPPDIPDGWSVDVDPVSLL